MSERFLHVVYCDDVRREEGGKISLMGCYQNRLFVPAMPTQLSKLCIVATIATAYEKPFKHLQLVALKNDSQLVEATFGETELEAHQSLEREDMGQPYSHNQMNAVFVISPFVIEEPCIITMVARTEEGELRGLPLRIGLAPQQ